MERKIARYLKSWASISKGEPILYIIEDGLAEVSLRTSDNAVWLTQADISDLFQKSPHTITQLVRVIFGERELSEGVTCKEFLQVRA